MSVGARSWKVVKPHLPLIKFNKRGKEGAQVGMNHKQQNSGTAKYTQTTIVLDHTEMPAKYCRKPLTQYEIEYIERGGPE